MALEDFDTHESAQSQVGQPAPKPAAAPVKAPVAKPIAAAPAPKSLESDDEDLFDFPVVEMKLESAAPAAPAPAPKKPAPPAAVKPAAAPAPVPAAPAPTPAQDKQAVAQAARIVEDLEQVLGPVDEPRPRELRLKGPAPLALAGIAAL